MPSLDDLARAFAAVSAIELLAGLFVSVLVVMLIPDWRLSLAALAAQYFFVAILLSALIPLQIAAVRLIAGCLVAVMFFVTARRADARPRRQSQARARIQWSDEPARGVFWMNLPFRMVAFVLVILSVIALSGQFVLLSAPTPFWVIGLWLALGGLMTIALTRDALKLGMSLLFLPRALASSTSRLIIRS